MRLAYHGGQCCGVKHIYGFPTMGPKQGLAPEIPITASKNISTEILDGNPVPTSTTFFSTPVVVNKEPWLDRFDRLIRYYKEQRFGGIAEVILMENKWYEGKGIPGQMVWEPFVLERGFKKVNSCWNSNSGNIVHVYHLNIVPSEKAIKDLYTGGKIVDGNFLPEWKLKLLKKEAKAVASVETKESE